MKNPNIIYILADDMGYGDMGCNNPECRIPTPNLNRLAETGMWFTDAHAGSSVCTPSRYNVLTGRYAWRSRLKRGIVWEWDGSLIEPDRLTAAEMLRQQGYRTACFGKWHLGWDWPTKDGRHPNETLPFGEGAGAARKAFGYEMIDYSGRIGGGPVDRGFDSYFGVDVPNFAPYAWFQDDRLTEQPTAEKAPHLYGNEGKSVPGWEHHRMIPEFTRRAETFIREQGGKQRQGNGNPFFIYFPLTSPHSPVVPNREFLGKSGIGSYGDFICEIDWLVGRITGALEEAGIRDNTLIIFTSDNGPENRVKDDEGAYIRAKEKGHYSMGPYRGIKRDIWEGGHREPFIASWPDVIPSGSVCGQLVGLGDFMATCAEITGTALPDGAGGDSISMLPLLKGETETPTRMLAVHHSVSGKFAVRVKDWVLIDDPPGGDNEEPDWFRMERGYADADLPGELYDLKTDAPERINMYRQRPDIVRELKELLVEIKEREK